MSRDRLTLGEHLGALLIGLLVGSFLVKNLHAFMDWLAPLLLR